MAYLKSKESYVLPSVTVSAEFVAATGPDDAAGTIDGNYKYHTFNATKTGAEGFVISSEGNGAGSDTLEYLVIAGGGGGGSQHGGGGGAGGYRTGRGYSVKGGVGNYNVTVGTGGARTSGASNQPAAASGSDSTFAGPDGNITSSGGGGGGAYHGIVSGISHVIQRACGRDGGSGGGGGPSDNSGGMSGFGGQGGGGGMGNPGNMGRYAGGGGGGAGGAAQITVDDTTMFKTLSWGPTTSAIAGWGGRGLLSHITGGAVYRAGGGGGGSYNNPTGAGLAQHGGSQGSQNTINSLTPTANYGGGGGGEAPGSNTGGSGTNGATGVVILRYKFQ